MAFLRLIPSEEIAVVILTNTGDEFPPQIVDEILSVLLPTYRLKRASAPQPSRAPAISKPSAALVGNWTGHIHTYRGDVPLTFSISAAGDVQAKLRSFSLTPSNRFEFTDQGLIGRLTGNINLGTNDDTGPEPYDLDVELYRKENILYGAVTTRPRQGARYGARLSYWVELKPWATNQKPKGFSD
jgi:hypothetical protein